MTPQELGWQIQNEYKEFVGQKFPSKIPDWFLEKLPAAIMSMPQSAVPYHAERIQQILTKTTETLSIFEAGLVVNILLAVKPEVFGWELEHFLLRRTELEQVRNEFSELTKKEEARLNRKQQALANMGGQKNNNHLIKT